MLTWLKALVRGPKAETRDEKVDRIRGLIGDVIPAFGMILEQSPMIIFPVAKLPLPKDEMKIALQLAWGMTTDDRMREHLGTAYLDLAHFRDDVNSPIDRAVEIGMSPDQVLNKIARYLEISESVTAETNELLREFQEFERLSQDAQTR